MFLCFLVLHFLLMLRCVLLILFRFDWLAILCATQGSRDSQRHSHTCTRWRGHSITSRFPNRREFWHYETSYQMHTPSRRPAKPSNHFRKPRGGFWKYVEQGRFLHVTFMNLCWFSWLLAYCLLICFVWPHAMAPAIASGQKKNKRLGLFVFVVCFGARPVSTC